MGTDRNKVLKQPPFDRSRWIQFPRDVVIGHDVLGQIPRVCEDLSAGQSVLIISGKRTYEVAGRQVGELMAAEGETSVVHFCTEGISLDIIRDAEESVGDADLIIGVGGGSVIDLAKIVSYNTGRQFISVPTAASHDGIASSRASVPAEGGSVSLAAHPPMALVADTGIIAGAPFRLLAAGSADIISNYTAALDWELSHRKTGEEISEYALALSRMTADVLVQNAERIVPRSEDACWTVVKALLSSGVAMSIAGSSRPASGAEHKFSHALDVLMRGQALHGEQCGIGTILMMYLHGGDWKSIRNSLQTIGAPVTPAEVGIPDATAAEALLLAQQIRPERYTILDEVELTIEKAEDLIGILYTN